MLVTITQLVIFLVSALTVFISRFTSIPCFKLMMLRRFVSACTTNFGVYEPVEIANSHIEPGFLELQTMYSPTMSPLVVSAGSAQSKGNDIRLHELKLQLVVFRCVDRSLKVINDEVKDWRMPAPEPILLRQPTDIVWILRKNFNRLALVFPEGNKRGLCDRRDLQPTRLS